MGIRNGQQYLASLRDQRQVIYDGRAIDDVTTEPDFQRTACCVAQFYDFQQRPENREVMTFVTENGDRAGMAFREARSKEQLRQRAAAYAAWAEVTCGFMGRSPDYMNTVLATLGSASPLIGKADPELGRRARRLYLEARDQDLCYTHTFTDPFKVMTAGPNQNVPTCSVVAETADGLVIRGARALATLAPFANMNFDLTGGARYDRNGTQYLCGFVTPVAAPGLRWICRDKLEPRADKTESRLASRIDEMDCVAVFEDCLVPWDCVYMFAPVSVDMPGLGFVKAGLQHHVLVRSVAKARFLVGLAHLIAESSHVNQFVNVQARLGEMVCGLRSLEAFAVAVVAEAYVEPVTGVYHPNPDITEVAGVFAAQLFPKMVSHIIDLGGSRYVSTTQDRTINFLGDLAEQYFRGDVSTAQESVALFRLGWEIAGSTWGARQDLYERFHSGDAPLRHAAAYLRFDKSQSIAMVRRILTNPSQDDEVFPEPAQSCGIARQGTVQEARVAGQNA